MALPDLLQWLATCNKTGLLGLTNGHFLKKIVFQDGIIISSASNDPREYLGQFLLSQHRISEEQLRMAMETQRSTGVMLGKILVMLNAITEPDLLAMLKRKAEESIFALFLWSDGSFEFQDQPVEEKNLFPLALRVEDVLLEGLRRYDELQVILKAFSPGEFVLQRTDQPVPATLAENPEVRRLLQVVDGQRTFTETCLEMHASEFKISRIAYELYRKGLLSVAQEGASRGQAPASHSAADLLARADQLLEQQKVGAALELLEKAMQSRPWDLALKKKLEDTEAVFVERAYQHFLPPGHVPTLVRSLEDLTAENLTPQEVFLVSRMNGSWTIKDVITISPLREVEALRALKGLRERGIIELRSA